MSLYYLDSSAWIKRYFNEAGSTAVIKLFDGRSSLACCRFGLVEVVSAIARRAHHEKIDPQRIAAQIELARRDFALFTQLEMTENICSLAEALGSRHFMRGADAVHLSAVVTLAGQAGEPITLVASDHELLQAGKTEGLTVLNPLI